MCLTKDGEVIFYVEEERLVKKKHYCYNINDLDEDFLGRLLLQELKKYTTKVDYIIFSSFGRHTEEFDWIIIRKFLNTINDENINFNTSLFFHENHHIYHASNAFYASGFDDAVALIMDGGGSFDKVNEEFQLPFREVETIYDCNYSRIKPVYNHYSILDEIGDENTGNEKMIFDKLDKQKVYSRSLSCGDLFSRMCSLIGLNAGSDSGKLMGLSGHHDHKKLIGFLYTNIKMKIIPIDFYTESKKLLEDEWFFEKDGEWITVLNLLNNFYELFDKYEYNAEIDPDFQESLEFYFAAAIANKVQEETYKHTCRLIRKAINLTGKNKIVLSGGYFMNCVNNYKYTKEFPEIEFFVDPIPHDGGTSIGAAKYLWHGMTKSKEKNPFKNVYFGPQYENKI